MLRHIVGSMLNFEALFPSVENSRMTSLENNNIPILLTTGTLNGTVSIRQTSTINRTNTTQTTTGSNTSINLQHPHGMYLRNRWPSAGSIGSNGTVTASSDSDTLENKQDVEYDPDAYEMDPICPGCFMTEITGGITCGARIHRHLAKRNMTTLEAAELVANEFPNKCAICNPSNCSENDRFYWRVDAVAPPALSAYSHYLHSVGEDSRIPKLALSNLTSFFADKNNVFPQRRYLFEYNPSIVRIPTQQIPQIPGEQPVYLASFRVSTIQNCLSQENELQMIGGSWPRPKSRDYLGLALLRADLSIITDTIVDFKNSVGCPHVEDYRVFMLHDTIYLSTYDFLYPLWLVVGPENRNQTLVELKQRYPSNFTVYSRNYGSCSPFFRSRELNKNMNFFVDSGTGQAIAELYPMAEKHPVDLHGICIVANGSVRGILPQLPIPKPSYDTIDILHFTRQGITKYPYTGERGSACCVPIQHPDGRNLLLGVSHSKVPFKGVSKRSNAIGGVGANEFFSSFYAMESTAPYNVIARTGRLCFGFASEDEAKSNPYTVLSRGHLTVGKQYNCPRIHFVSGMVEKADDPSRMIVAYGVNDCVPRMIEISKDDVSRILFRQQGERLRRRRWGPRSDVQNATSVITPILL